MAQAYSNGWNAHEDDDYEEIDYSDIEEKYAVYQEDPLASTVLIDGAPVVGDDKKPRLFAAIRKFALERGVEFEADAIEMPSGSDGKSKGFLFVTLSSPAAAEDAAKRLSDAFDRKHTFTCITLNAIDELQELPNEFEAPEEDADQFKAKEHLKGWLMDSQARDQMVLVRGDDVQISWNHKGHKMEIDHERKKWTEKYCLWSPSGTMLATLHAQGVGLWGGNSFSRINRFPHLGVNFLDFSPFERYMVTLSAIPIEAARVPSQSNPFTEDDEGNHIAVWEIATGRLLRTFPMAQETPAADGQAAQKKVFTWPILKWSGDEKYVARVTPGQSIQVYEAPDMYLLDKKSIKLDGVVDFEWAPLNEKELQEVEEEIRGAPLAVEEDGKPNGAAAKDKKKEKKKERENTLAYWLPENQNQPARVALMAIPSRENLRTKNLFNVADCKLHWQDSGDYLCVKVDRLTKSKKATYCNLELFRVREKAIPIQTVEIKDTVTAFAWEPKGDRFALITSNDPALGQDLLGQTIKTSINFYQLDPRKGDFISLASFDQKTCNRIFWSPRGRHVLFATLGSNTKFDMEFWDVELDKESKQQQAGPDSAASTEPPSGAGISLLTTVEHYGMTGIEWDPSGRYIAAVGSIWLGSMEAGYTIYDFKGAELSKNTPLDKFKQLLWRPRPRSLLAPTNKKQITRNLRKYGREFDEADQLEELNVSSELQAQRRRLIDEWNAWRQRTKRTMEEEKEQGGKHQKALEAKEEAQYATETFEEYIEEVIEETEEIVN